MNRLILTASAALAALSLAACGKPADTAENTANTTGPTDSMTSTQTPNTGPGAGMAAAGDKAQDVVAAGVGDASAATMGRTTKGFVTGAASSDMYEIQAADIAMERSTSKDVKALAAMLKKAHTKTTATLTGILAKDKVDAAPPEKLDERRTGMLDNLRSAEAKNFDKTWLDQQKAAHTEALMLFKTYADNGDNADIKAFAAKTAPDIQMHLDKATALDAAK